MPVCTTIFTDIPTNSHYLTTTSTSTIIVSTSTVDSTTVDSTTVDSTTISTTISTNSTIIIVIPYMSCQRVVHHALWALLLFSAILCLSLSCSDRFNPLFS
eukprot:NODE_5955_length_621_cov_25.449301_g5553_i0.p1 GENE.NODE_5955_length_621_cov_25.449301_g5553_i0~~NODE_5955_length_621_cov_25.449301_g5553_i0.p1  ORF type:complete len:101 (-),score=6.76 NODE_5955_length_621_cov_25.449301_g5553_i0:101-403(-)